MSDTGDGIRYEVHWMSQGERQSLQFSDLDEAVQCAVRESRGWAGDTVRVSHEAAHHQSYKRATVYAIGPSRRRRPIETYENGEPVVLGLWS